MEVLPVKLPDTQVMQHRLVAHEHKGQMGQLREGDGFLRGNPLLGVPVHQHQLVPVDGVELVHLRVQLIHTHHGKIQLTVV